MEAEVVQRVELTPFQPTTEQKPCSEATALGAHSFLLYSCSSSALGPLGSWTSSGALFPSTTPADLLPAMGEGREQHQEEEVQSTTWQPDLCPVNSDEVMVEAD